MSGKTGLSYANFRNTPMCLFVQFPLKGVNFV